MELEKLTEHFYYTRPIADIDQPILGAVLGNNLCVMVDGGVSPDMAREFKALLRSATGRKPDFCVVTHWHWDHTFGLAGVGCPIIGQKNLQKHLKRLAADRYDRTNLLKRVAEKKEISFCADNILKVYGEAGENVQIAPAGLLYDNELLLDLGGVNVVLHHFPSDHSDDATSIFIKEDRVLLLGDAMCEEFYADKPFHTPEAVLAQFDYIDSLGDIDWYLLSHAAPQNNHHFALTYEVLRVAAEGYRQGYTEKTMLGDYIKENLDVGTPDDYEQTAEFFYNGQFGTRYDL